MKSLSFICDICYFSDILVTLSRDVIDTYCSISFNFIFVNVTIKSDLIITFLNLIVKSRIILCLFIAGAMLSLHF